MGIVYFYFPPLPKASGGMQVIAALAEHLDKAGRAAKLVIQKNSPLVGQWLAARSLCSLLGDFDKISPEPEDVWIVPEGWPLALKPGLEGKSRCIVYAQNWAYVHGHLPEGVSWRDLPVEFWSVSAPVAAFVRETTGFDSPIVPPAIDGDLFCPDNGKKTGKKATIAWMPRKNRGLALQIRQILEAIRQKGSKPLPVWLEIDGKSSAEVAALLWQSDIFLASGFPEGCPLPPLEAMSSGCIVCGFAGFGGWDYMRQGMPGGYRPAFNVPLRDWGPNGLFAADADTFGAAKALNYALDILDKPEGQIIRANAARTAAFYSAERQKEMLLAALEG